MAKRSGRQLEDTQAHDLEGRLLETVQRYELIFKATNDVIYDVDLAEGTVTWNDAFYQRYGYPKKDNQSSIEWWASHIHPDDAVQLDNVISTRTESENDLWEAEYRYQKADGSYVYVRDRGIILRKQSGTPIRIIGSFLDITAQVQLDRAKDEFISLVSHQLRTPLTVVRMYGDMLTSGYFGSLTDDQRTNVKKMTDASILLIGVVGDILDTSRIELGHIVVNPTATDVNEFIKMNIEGLLQLATEREVSLRLVLDEEKQVVPIDIVIFGRILQNLVLNAIRYTKPKTGYVEVTFRCNGDGYLLSVHDNGMGIPREDRGDIFKRFFRGENNINVTEQGAGLGLYIVKHLAEAAGCKVWYKSQKGKGTTFFVSMPQSGMKATKD